MKYPSIDLNEETHPLLWQYKNVFVQNGHIRVFIVFMAPKMEWLYKLCSGDFRFNTLIIGEKKTGGFPLFSLKYL